MQKYIEKLRSKSEETRKQILIWSLIFCMSIVFFIWINGLGHNTKNKAEKEIDVQEESVIKPFSLLKTSIKDAYKDVSSGIKEIKINPTEEKELEEEIQEEALEETVESGKQEDIINIPD